MLRNRDHPGPGEFLAAVEVGGSHGVDIELAAEGEGVRAVVDDRADYAGGGRGGADGVSQQLGGRPGGRWVSPPSGPLSTRLRSAPPGGFTAPLGAPFLPPAHFAQTAPTPAHCG